jgi:phosphoenolpyruvate carboxykinase (GTP)
MGSETTAAAVGQMGIVRRDPFAMLPFCGYNMGDYFKHWLKMGSQLQAATAQSGAKMPKIYQVNWFRRDTNGNFVWPGFGQNMRVLEWIIDRVEGRANAQSTTAGLVPEYDDLHWQGSDFSKDDFGIATYQDKDQWKKELVSHGELFDKLGDHVPAELHTERDTLESRLNA